MRQLRWLTAVALFAALFGLSFSFVLDNGQRVVLDLPLVQPLRPPLWAALAGAFFAGALGASAGLLFQVAKKTLAARRWEKRAAGLESEIHQLRNLPLAANDPLLAPESPAERMGR